VKVFITRPIPQAAIGLLAPFGETHVHPADAPLSPGQLTEAVRDCDGLVVSGTRVNAEVIGAAPHLKAIANVGVGYDNIDVAACTARGIPVTNTPGVLDETTADLAFALLMAVARRVVESDTYVREGRWQRWEWGLLWGRDIHHKTLGIVGFGRIGQAMARRGLGFDMRVLYYARTRAEAPIGLRNEAGYAPLQTLLAEADFVSLHVPLTAHTRHLIGGGELARMRTNAFLINTSRGAVVDEEALVQALKDGTIAGAGLDVFEHEPQPHPELASLPNVVLTPHIGSATSETRLAMAMLAAKNMVAMLRCERPPNLVNPEILVGAARSNGAKGVV
jgi:glyoxylate reductase